MIAPKNFYNAVDQRKLGLKELNQIANLFKPNIFKFEDGDIPIGPNYSPSIRLKANNIDPEELDWPLPNDEFTITGSSAAQYTFFASRGLFGIKIQYPTGMKYAGPIKISGGSKLQNLAPTESGNGVGSFSGQLALWFTVNTSVETVKAWLNEDPLVVAVYNSSKSESEKTHYIAEVAHEGESSMLITSSITRLKENDYIDAFTGIAHYSDGHTENSSIVFTLEQFRTYIKGNVPIYDEDNAFYFYKYDSLIAEYDYNPIIESIFALAGGES